MEFVTVLVVETLALVLLVSSFRLLRQCPSHLEDDTLVSVSMMPVLCLVWTAIVTTAVFTSCYRVHRMLQYVVYGVILVNACYTLWMGTVLNKICEDSYCECVDLWTHFDYLGSVILQVCILCFIMGSIVVKRKYKILLNENTATLTMSQLSTKAKLIVPVALVVFSVAVFLTIYTYYYATCTNVFKTDILTFPAEPDTDSDARVMVWSASPFGFVGGAYNTTEYNTYMEQWGRVANESVIDEICVIAMTLWPNASLVVHENIRMIIDGLSALNYTTTALIGTAWNEYDGAFFEKVVFNNETFLTQLEVAMSALGGNVTGLNYDFEPIADTVTKTHACEMAALCNETRTRFDFEWNRSSNTITIDTGESAMNDAGLLYGCKGSSAIDTYYSMNTYRSSSCNLRTAIHQHVHDTSATSYAIGLSTVSSHIETDLFLRKLIVAQRMCVKRLAFFSEARFVLDSPRVIAGLREWREYVTDKC